MRFKPPDLRGDQRFIFLGQTGSGKSFLARFLLKQFRGQGWRIVIVDPKKDWMSYRDEKGVIRQRPFAEDDGKHLGTIDHPIATETFRPELCVQIFQPLEWDGNTAAFFQAIIKTKNTIVYVDEITQLANANNVPKEMKIVWTQGRSLNIGAWCSTQRPLGIPVLIKDQAEVWYIFRIFNKDDRKVVEGYLPVQDMPEIVEKPLPYFWFYFWEEPLLQPVLFMPVKVKELEKKSA